MQHHQQVPYSNHPTEFLINIISISFLLTKSSTPSSFPSTVRIPMVHPTPTPTSISFNRSYNANSRILFQTVPKRLSSGVPKHAATAVLAFPAFANEMSDTKSPTELAHAKNVSPIIAESIFQMKPRAVNRPTTSFASV